MSTTKRCISLLLAIIILVGVFSPAAQAAPAGESASVNTDNVTIEGTNGFGNLLSQEITESQEEAEAAGAEYPGGYTVTDLVIEGTTATVTYDTMEEATLVVALYTEDGMQMLTSATATVAPDATEAELTFEGEMPEYFLASAYLMDSYDLSPLCAAYDTPMYTREMQELLASTVNDYDPEKVLNLDEDETTNFAVYADSTIVIEPVEGKNIVASIDNENATYVIKNADEQMLSLQVGDILAYAYDKNELLIVRVGSIEVNGTTVTIIGAELEMSEAFEAVKIDGSGETEDIVVDDSAAGEGISYVGLVEEDGVNNPNSVEGGDTTTLKHKFEIKIKSKADDGHTSASLAVSGSLDLALDVSVKYYISTSQKYVEFKLSPHLTFSLGVQESLMLSAELGYLAVSPVPGVYVGFEPELQLKLDCKTQFKATLKSVIGFQYDTASGVQNISKKPELDVGIDVEGTIFLGVDFCPQVAIVSDKLSEIEVNMLVGFELEAKASGKAFEAYKKDADEYHECQECIAIDVRVKAKIGGTLKFLDQDWLSVSITIGEWTHKLGEMYYSLDNDEFGIGKCPNKLFRVTVQVKDKEYNPIPGETVTVSTFDEALTTDENGLVVFYTPEDEIVVRAEKDGYFSAERVTINRARKLVLCLIYQLDGGDNGGSTGSSEPGNPFEGIDFGGIADRGNEMHSGTCGKNLTWTLYENGLLAIDGTGAMTNFSTSAYVPWNSYLQNIKSVQIENGVTSIGDYAFYYCVKLETVTIPDSITSIGFSAFSGCDNLTSVTIPNSVTSIGNYVFAYCDRLTSVTIPDSITYIGKSVFRSCCSLMSVSIPNSITSISDYAFADCDNLTSMTLPDGIVSIGDSAFYSCGKLTSVTLSDSITSIGDNAFHFCNKLTSVTIPDSVISIGDGAFGSCDNLTGILVDINNPSFSSDAHGVLFNKNQSELRQAPGAITGSYSVPNGVMSIGNCAFQNCHNLTSVILPDSITSIEDSAFSSCESLTTVNIPDSVTTIGDYAFYFCESLKSMTISEGVTTIGNYVFGYCDRLTSVTIPDSVITIGDYAFYFCENLRNVTIPNSVATIGIGAFAYCDGLRNLDIPNSVTSIGGAAFESCVYLANVNLSNSITSINDYTFQYCYSLKDIDIPDSVTTIGAYAFKACENLTSIIIPDSINSIEDGAFAYCKRMKNVSFEGNPPSIGWNVLNGVTANAYYPADNPTWTTDVMQNYGGTITWVPYTPVEGSSIIGELTEISAQRPTVEIKAVYGGEYDTEITEEATFKTASFMDLVPGEQYVMLAMVSVEGADPLAAENLLGIAQGTAAEDGTLSFRYIQRIPYDISYVVVCGASSKNLNDAEIAFPDMVADGELQVVDPVVAYDGVTLTEGRDYVIAGKVDFTEAGEYTCYIRGIHNYAGLVECTYTVAEHEHSFTNYVSNGNATCTEDGTKTARCDHCDATDTIPDAGSALGHDMGNWETTVPATCTENGEEQSVCSRCDHSESRTVEATGHSYGAWTVIQEPTTTEEGLEERSCTRCGHTEQHSIAKLENPFTDVQPGSFYYEPVMWAIENGITNGTSVTTFGPNDQCMRAHVVTFLWRAVGSPEPTRTDNPFVDVPENAFYYKPVMWALENGITSGLDATHFGPTAYCNRAQVVTFLYRTVGSPELESMDNPFTDVQAGAFYEKPVLWAVKNGITNGLSATSFGPTAICNRAQIVTFLYRAFVD